MATEGSSKRVGTKEGMPRSLQMALLAASMVAIAIGFQNCGQPLTANNLTSGSIEDVEALACISASAASEASITEDLGAVRLPASESADGNQETLELPRKVAGHALIGEVWDQKRSKTYIVVRDDVGTLIVDKKSGTEAVGEDVSRLLSSKTCTSPMIQFAADASVTVEGSVARIEVKRTGSPQKELDVPVIFSGSASPESDFEGNEVIRLAHFARNEQKAYIEITIIADNQDTEGVETIELSLQPSVNNSLYTIGSKPKHTLQINSGESTPSPSPTPQPGKATPKPVATATPKPVATATPKPVATATPKPVATATPKPVATATPKPVATATPKPVATPTPKPAPTATPKPAPTATPKPAPTATPKPAPTATPKPVATATPKPVATPTPKPVATATPKPAPTATPKPVATATPKPATTATPKPAI